MVNSPLLLKNLAMPAFSSMLALLSLSKKLHLFLIALILVYLQIKAEFYCNKILVLPVIRLQRCCSLKGGEVGSLNLVTNELHNLRSNWHQPTVVCNYRQLTVNTVCQAAYISVISDSCCSIGRARKSWGVVRVSRWQRSERESLLSLSTVCDHQSAALLYNAMSL